MIIGKIHPGSGIGDQLFSYIVTRVIALDRGYEFGFVGKEFFKGKDFMNLDWGTELNYIRGHQYEVLDNGGIILNGEGLKKVFKFDKPYYDPEVNFIEDETVIDGYGAQDERYWGHRLERIADWLDVEWLNMPEDLCVINFRGGEYTTIPDLFLPQEYWDKAVEGMKKLYPNIRFEVHTDDPVTANQYFPDFKIWDNKMITADKQYVNISFNWRSLRYAKHMIISNSAFPIIPALINGRAKEVIAPRCWAGRNVGEWRRPQNYYKKFIYI